MKTPGRTLALGTLAGAIAAAALGYAAEPAAAAYTAKVKAGTLTISGDGASDRLALRLQAGTPTRLQVDVGDDGTAEFTFDRSTFAAVVVDGGRGDDQIRVDQSNGAFTDEALTLGGGDGDDTLIGGAGADTLLGGAGHDVAFGGQGADRARLGKGDDRFVWNPGDASDTVDGEAGTDMFELNGGNVTENFELAANGGRVRLTRDVGNVVADLGTLERIALRPVGGPDTVVVDRLAGTGATSVEVDFGILGAGDAFADRVIVRGTAAAEAFAVSGSSGAVAVSGLGATTRVLAAEALDEVVLALLGGDDTVTAGIGAPGPGIVNLDGGEGTDTVRYDGTAGPDAIPVLANGTEATVAPAGETRIDLLAERLVVSGLGGPDTLSAVGNLAALTALTLDGGGGDDTLLGGNGDDLLLGGPGNDLVDGNQGADQASLGDGDDRFAWDPGDGSDTIEGGTGNDRLELNGSNIAEAFELAANGGRVRLTRNVGNVVLDLDDVETVGLRAAGGADVITVGDLTGSDVAAVDVDLAAAGGGGDGLADTVIVNGTAGPDVVSVTRSGAQVVTSGLAATTRIEGSEAALDLLRVQTLAGDDDVTVAPDVATLIATFVDLGADG